MKLFILIKNKMKEVTLWFIIKDGKILLPLKKRGFGEGLYNGFGWKLENWETPQQAMIREAKEEIWIDITKLVQKWIITFIFEEKPERDQKGYIYLIDDFKWNIVETEEMKPYWFDLDKIPYDKMWEDDKIWLPVFLSGENFEFEFIFDKNGKLRKHRRIR